MVLLMVVLLLAKVLLLVLVLLLVMVLLLVLARGCLHCCFTAAPRIEARMDAAVSSFFPCSSTEKSSGRRFIF